eukprot:5153206-Pyramimonas_sp.AAC.1
MAQSAQEQANEIAQIVEGQLTESLKSRFEKVENDLMALTARRQVAPQPSAPSGQQAAHSEAGLVAYRRKIWVGGFPRPLLKK